MRIFFTSDHHFDHAAAALRMGRPFSSVAEMNEILIQEHNKVVGRGDIVHFLGDFCWGAQNVSKYLSSLNGHKHLITGNHDKVRPDQGWMSVQNYRFMTAQGHKLVLFHYPILDWADRKHGSVHLHGHTHSHHRRDTENAGYRRRINMCVEAWQYRPVELDEVLEFVGVGV